MNINSFYIACLSQKLTTVSPNIFFTTNVTANSALSVQISTSGYIDWGDGSIQFQSIDLPTTHTYLSSGPANICFTDPAGGYNLWSVIVKPAVSVNFSWDGGVLNVSRYIPYMTNFQFTNMNAKSAIGLSGSPVLSKLYIQHNNLSGAAPQLENFPNLKFLNYTYNQFTGSVGNSISASIIMEYQCEQNQLSGSIPALPVNLMFFNASANQLTGSIPLLTNNTALSVFRCTFNKVSSLTLDLSGNWPVNINLGEFRVNNNSIPQAYIDQILLSFVNANRTTGTRILLIGGSGNGAPSAAGLVNKATLASRGWTVTTN